MKAQSNGAVRLGPSFACGHEVPACFKYAVTDVRRTKTVREADIAACVMIAMRLGGQHSTEDASPAGLLAQRQAEVVTGVFVDAAIGPGADDKGVKDEIRSAAADQDERQEIGADDFEKEIRGAHIAGADSPAGARRMMNDMAQLAHVDGVVQD